MKDKITTVIGSCDAYSYLWKNFDILYNRYFEPDLNRILVSETKVFDNSKYLTTTPGALPWGARVLDALDKVTTEYVYFILEDFFFTKRVTNELLQNSLDVLIEKNGDKVLIDTSSKFYSLIKTETKNVYKFNVKSEYLNSVSPSIWKVKYFKKVLKPEYSAWDFELTGNGFASSLKPNILLNKQEEKYFLPLVRKQGYRMPGWEELFEKEGLTDEK